MINVTQRILNSTPDEFVPLEDGEVVNLAELVEAGYVTLHTLGGIQMGICPLGASVLIEASQLDIEKGVRYFRASVLSVKGPIIIGEIPTNDQPFSEGIDGHILLPEIAGNDLQLFGNDELGYLTLRGITFTAD